MYLEKVTNTTFSELVIPWWLKDESVIASLVPCEVVTLGFLKQALTTSGIA
jgi:hypothetical protein